MARLAWLSIPDMFDIPGRPSLLYHPVRMVGYILNDMLLVTIFREYSEFRTLRNSEIPIGVFGRNAETTTRQ